jgi:hypothetical protein
MATQKGLMISGKVGPHIYKIVNGKQIITSRAAPGSMKKSPAMLNYSKTFGMASSLGAQLRKSLVGSLNGFHDSEMVNRLNSHMVKILAQQRNALTGNYNFEPDSFKRLEGFEFNSNSNVKDLFKLTPTSSILDGTLSVKIKGFDVPRTLKFPATTYHCKFTLALSLFRLKNGSRLNLAETQTVEITKDKSKVGPFEFNFRIPDGCFYVLSLFLDYATAGKLGWKSIHDKEFNPGCICAARFAEGTDVGDPMRHWVKMMKYT